MCLGEEVQCEKYIACRAMCIFQLINCHGNSKITFNKHFKSQVFPPRCNVILPSAGELVKGSKVHILLHIIEARDNAINLNEK